MPDPVAQSEGRCAFGEDPYRYDRARPPYPNRVFERLMAAGNIHAGSKALDIGAGMGVVARRIAELGASHVTVVEPDQRFHPMLERLAMPKAAGLQLIVQTFESAILPSASVDLAVSATAFHWKDARIDDIVRTGVLTQPEVELMRWSIQLSPAHVHDLYASFSPIQKLSTEKRAVLLDQLADIAVRQFNGVVERPMLTALYVATRI